MSSKYDNWLKSQQPAEKQQKQRRSAVDWAGRDRVLARKLVDEARMRDLTPSRLARRLELMAG